MPDISRRASALGTENAFVVLAEVNALARQGKDIISFCIGQPDFPAPEHVQEAAIRAIKGGKHGYTPSAGIDELRDLSPKQQQRLIEQRADEYARALELEVPVDVRQTPDGYEKVIRPRPRGRVGQGDGLAPGWAEGKPLVQVDPDGEVDILCGHRVDGNDVLALRPLGVVTEVGSILSHVAIVCRELGIPLVAGVDIADFDGSSSVVVDGWTGTVQVSG